jgi:hypothetical protein
MTPAQCAAHRSAVWVLVGQQGFCVRYYVSTAGGQGDTPVVFLEGDKLGVYDPKTRTFRPRPGKKTPDVNTDDLQKIADHVSRWSKTTAIYVARIGVDGSSGFAGNRRTYLELYMINAALDAIRKRHGFRGFHLVGQSGGAGLIGGLLGLRTDIGCAVPGAGRLARLTHRPQGRPHLEQIIDPIQRVPNVVRNRPRRVIVVTDPQDATVPERHQTAFVQALRRAGYAAEQFFVETYGENRHGVTPYAILVVAACVRNMSNQQIAAALTQFQQRYLARRRGQQTAGGAPGNPSGTPSYRPARAPQPSRQAGPAARPAGAPQPSRQAGPMRLPSTASLRGPSGAGPQYRRF